MKASLILLLLFLWVSPGWADTPLAKATFDTRKVDAAVDNALAEKRIVGAVILISEDGRLVYRRAAGLADREASIPVTEDTLFRLASVSKAYVSAAAMKLVEQGRLRLDDPVTKWLPDFRPKMPDGSEPTITVRQLLTHTSGLSYTFNEPLTSPYHLLGISDGVDQPGLSLEQNLQRLAQAPLLHQPGSAYRYSLSIDVLGAVIAKASDQPLPDAVRSLVLEPLHLDHTAFLPTEPHLLAAPYANSPSGLVRMVDGTKVAFAGSFIRFEPSRSVDPNAYPSGGGGMIGCAEDLLRFLEAVRTGGGAMLKPATVAEMCKDQLGNGMEGHKAGRGFGYGWAVLRDPAAAKTQQSPGTIQWGGVYGNSYFMDPAKKITVVVLSNTAFEGMAGQLPSQIRAAIYGNP